MDVTESSDSMNKKCKRHGGSAEKGLSFSHEFEEFMKDCNA
jgi:hypothetical protein